MKAVLIKVAIFFGISTLGLIAAYTLLDPQGTTMGDVRFIKSKSVMGPDQYDALIIGSSRVYDVENLNDCNFRFYNYSFIQGLPSDYPPFIEHALKHQPIKKIILGLDFYGTSVKGFNDARSSWKPSTTYVNQVTEKNFLKKAWSIYDFSRFKRLVNYKVLGNDPFERKTTTQVENTEWKTVFMSMYESAYAAYKRNDSLANHYKAIHSASKDIPLVVYITPESEPLFRLMEDKGLQAEYENFLRTAVEVFGEVHNLMEVNQFTRHPGNFKDESHLTEKNLRDIICELSANRTPPQGTLLTKENIDEYLKSKSYLR